jgi:hypothetical protein
MREDRHRLQHLRLSCNVKYLASMVARPAQKLSCIPGLKHQIHDFTFSLYWTTDIVALPVTGMAGAKGISSTRYKSPMKARKARVNSPSSSQGLSSDSEETRRLKTRNVSLEQTQSPLLMNFNECEETSWLL